MSRAEVRRWAAELAERWPLLPETGTRARIVEAAWDLVGRLGTARVGMRQVAAAAGVSRQSVYLHFGSRAGLLVAMVRHRDAVSRYVERLEEELSGSPPGAVLEVWIRRWNDYLPEILPVAEVLALGAIADPDAREAWRDRMEHHLAGLHILFRLLARRRLLARGWTPEEAADFFWSLVHLDTYRHLVGERGWDPGAYTERLTEAARRIFLVRPREGGRRGEGGG